MHQKATGWQARDRTVNLPISSISWATATENCTGAKLPKMTQPAKQKLFYNWMPQTFFPSSCLLTVFLLGLHLATVSVTTSSMRWHLFCVWRKRMSTARVTKWPPAGGRCPWLNTETHFIRLSWGSDILYWAKCSLFGTMEPDWHLQ